MTNNTCTPLGVKLSKFGKVVVCKEGHVFTLLIIGTGLAKFNTTVEIQSIVIGRVGLRYPVIECLHNDDTYYSLVLRGRFHDD